MIRSADDLEAALAADREGGPRVAFATASDETWLEIIRERPDVVAWNKTTTEPVLLTSAGDPEECVRFRIAMT